MTLITNLSRWFTGKLDPSTHPDAMYLARRVPEWGLVELPELRKDLNVRTPFVGTGPTQ
ncbi:MAG: hypothetical protein M3281_04645 [Chloroflexota bacterium]|nr:hypothetical protein [Chloroflexota bacterium]